MHTIQIDNFGYGHILNVTLIEGLHKRLDWDHNTCHDDQHLGTIIISPGKLLVTVTADLDLTSHLQWRVTVLADLMMRGWPGKGTEGALELTSQARSRHRVDK